MPWSIGSLFYRDPQNEAPETARYRYGQRIIWWGFLLIGVVAIAGIIKYDDPAKVTPVVSAVSTVIGTVIGAFFGVAAGSAGREQSEALNRRLLAEATPEKAKQALEDVHYKT